jgi:phage repressor protein C with HTH and peptisase S24 domain
MSPYYESGDEVACQRIDDTHFIQWGKVHVLDTTQGIIIKRIYEEKEGIRCASYNPEYPDFIIPKDEVYSISLVVGLLRL